MLEPEREYLAITIGQLANGWPDRDARLNPLKALVALAQQVGKRHRIAVPVGSRCRVVSRGDLQRVEHLFDTELDGLGELADAH